MKVRTLLLMFALWSYTGYAKEQTGNHELGFTEVYRVVESMEHQLYVITDQGTWHLVGDQLIKVTERQKQTVPMSGYSHLFPDSQVLNAGRWKSWSGLAFVLLTIIITFGYLYYQGKIKRGRDEYLNSIRNQRQILDIAFWATGDEVLDCNLSQNKVTKLNKNSDFRLPSDVYFLSETFIERIHPEDRGHFRSHFELLLDGGNNNYELNYRVKSKGDTWMWFVERGVVIERNRSGRALRLISCIRDVTAIKQEQEQFIRLANELKRRLKLAEAQIQK